MLRPLLRSRPSTLPSSILSLPRFHSSPMTASEDAPHPSPEKALPAPSDAAPTATTLDLSTGGSTVKLDALGPMVVNQDGTMSRITNWGKMTEVERENTLRIIGKRNQMRLAALRKAKDSQP